MKVEVYNKKGEKVEEMNLSKDFIRRIREDILQRVYEYQKGLTTQSYGIMPGAGASYSASGILKHRRHAWKSTYGKGISRIPRKILSRHGSSFNWVGATVSNTRGGRRPHGPKGWKNLVKKVNKKEYDIAFSSAVTGIFSKESIKKKYGREIKSGLIFDKEMIEQKTKNFRLALENAFGAESYKMFKDKKIRSGIGKRRGRKYKSTSGLLFVIGNDEKMNRKGIDVRRVKELTVKDMSPNGKPGRICAFTREAIKQLEEKIGNGK